MANWDAKGLGKVGQPPRSFLPTALALVRPNADVDARLQVQFSQDMLDVLLDCSRAAFQNFPDLLVTLSRDDPLHDLQFPPGQIRRLGLGYA